MQHIIEIIIIILKELKDVNRSSVGNTMFILIVELS